MGPTRREKGGQGAGGEGAVLQSRPAGGGLAEGRLLCSSLSRPAVAEEEPVKLGCAV